MSILAIDTSLDRLGLCLLDGERARSVSVKGIGRQDMALERSLRRIVPDQKALQGVSLIAVCTGPGRFTGIRVGVTFGVILGRTLDVSVTGLNALECLAWQAAFETRRLKLPAAALVCAARPVVRDEIFWGLYRVGGGGDVRAETPDLWGAPALLRQAFKGVKEPVLFIGEAAQAAASCAALKGAIVVAQPLKPEALARRAAFLQQAARPLPAPEPYYLKPGNYEKNARP